MADSQGSGCLKGCGCFLLILILLVIVIGLAGVFFIDSNTISPLQPEKLRALSADICSGSIPDSCTPMFGIDFPFARGTLFMDSNNGATNVYIMTMDTSLVKSLNDTYIASYVGERFDSQKPKSRKTLPLDPIYFDVTNRVNRFATYMVLQNKQKRVIYEAYFTYKNRLVLAAYIARSTNYMASGQAFIDSIGPPVSTVEMQEQNPR